MESRFLECQATPGMFPNEYSVIVEVKGFALSFFAPRDTVRKQGNRSMVEVELLDVESGTVALPGEPYERGNRYIQVEPEELKHGFS